MRQEVRDELDRINLLKPGSGALSGYLFGRGTLDEGTAGLGAKYEHRVTDSASLFARGELGYQYGDASDLVWEAMAGGRWTW